jgi:hypothetical protein
MESKMKTLIFIILLSANAFAQDSTVSIESSADSAFYSSDVFIYLISVDDEIKIDTSGVITVTDSLGTFEVEFVDKSMRERFRLVVLRIFKRWSKIGW